MKKIIYLALLALGTSSLGYNALQSADSENIAAKESAVKESAVKESGVDYFADNGLGNAVAVVQHPAGEYHNGITYVSYQGPKEDPYVAAYNHNSKEWSGPFKAGVSALGKDPSRKIDNHGKPTMIIDKAGYIHVFFGGHGGKPEHGPNPLGNPHDGENKHVVSKRPYDISEWEPLDNIPPFGTYNQVVMMDNGDLYLFYRHGAHRSNWVYQKSTDNGRTFDAPVSFLKHKRRTDFQAHDSWYPFVTKGIGDEIIVSFDYHLCWDNAGAPDERGHTANRQDLYYMTFNTADGSWHNIKDEKLAMPLTREMADEKALVTRSGDLWSFNGSVTLDEKGYPHIGIVMGKDIGLKAGGPKQMRHLHWSGSEWLGGESTDLPIGNGDLVVDNNIRFLLESKTPQKEGIVAWWESEDDGRTFKRGDILLKRPNSGFAISAFIRNAHPDALVIAAQISGGDERKMFLLGQNGAIGRDAKSANILHPK